MDTTDQLYSLHEERDKAYFENKALNAQHVYIDDRYNMEKKFSDEKEECEWLDKDLTGLLDFMKTLCAGCYKPAQIYLRSQMPESYENIVNDRNVGTYSSIDLISTLVDSFIEIIQELDDYLYCDVRATKVVVQLLDALLQLIYGPRIENQLFLAQH